MNDWLRQAAVCFLALGAVIPLVVRAQPVETGALRSLDFEELEAFPAPLEGWVLAGEAWTLWDSTALVVQPGETVLVRRQMKAAPSKLRTTWAHGDLVVELEYLTAKAADFGVLLQGRYEIVLGDSWGVPHPTYRDAGALDGLHAPRMNASRAPGIWQHIRIVFEAPQYDDAGRKTRNARLREVVHNGMKVQEALEVTAPTERALHTREGPEGPLVIQAGSGEFAVRNIRYRPLRQIEPVVLKDVRYELYEGEFRHLEGLGRSSPDRVGESYGYVWDQFGTHADRIGLRWTGNVRVPETGAYTFAMRFNWIDEIPYEEDAVAGQGRLEIGGAPVIEHRGEDSTAWGSVYLAKGEHPFTLTYFKNRKGWRPIVFLRVQGEDLPEHYLNAPRTLPEPESVAPPLPVEPVHEPYVLRSFAHTGDSVRTNVVSVGDPVGIHYLLDLETGTLLHVWKGPFADVGSMWHGRGEGQEAVPIGPAVSMADVPQLVRWSGTDELVVPPLRFQGYMLGTDRRPIFRYVLDGADVTDRLEPSMEGRALARRLEISRPGTGGASGNDTWLRLAQGSEIVQRRPGLFCVEQRYCLAVPAGAQPAVRPDGTGEELLVPLIPASGASGVSYTIIW